MSNFIAKNLRYLRKGLRLSQEGLAKLVDMNRGNIASYEKGTAEPNADKMMRFSHFFSVNLNDFIEKDLEQEANNPPPAGSGFVKLSELQALKSPEEIQAILADFARLEKIFSGLQELHSFQLSKYEEYTPAMRMLVNDHERLLEITTELIRLFKDITGQTAREEENENDAEDAV